jgi:type I restriction enzyme, S subunit
MELRPGYKRTEVGVIPEEWEVVPLRRLITSVEYGSSAKSNVHGHTPVLRMGNLQGGKVDWDDLVYTNDESEIRRYTLKPGDVLFNRTNTIDLVGKTSIYKGERPAIFAGYLIRINVDKSLLNSEYLNYALNAEFSRRHSAKVLSVAVGQANINGQKVKTYPIPLPSTLAEQEAIAEALSDTDALIESLDQLIAKKRDLEQAAMQELLRPKDNDEVRLLKEISSLKGRIGWQGLKQSEFTANENEPFLITGMNFKDGAIRWNEVYHVSEQRYDIAKDIQLRTGDVLMTKDGTIGKVLYIDEIPSPGKASLNSHLLLFRPIRESYHPKYLYYQLNSKRFTDFIELGKSGSTFFGISQAVVGKYPVLIPPIDKQIAIAAVLSDMDAEIAALEARRDKTRLLKQGMMQELLTGRMRLV